MDGAWGRNSASAMTRYARESSDAPAREYHAAMIAYETADFLDTGNWSYEYFDALGLAVLLPKGNLIQGEHTSKFLNYEHTRSSLKLSLAFGGFEQAQSIHNYAELFAADGTKPYTVRKQGFAVTSAKSENHETLYVRSKLWNGSWGTILISTWERDAGLMAAISASITDNKYASLYIPRSGYLFSVAENTADLLELLERKEYASKISPDTSIAQPVTTEPSVMATGSGFFVSPEGHALTNAHVVDDCRSLKFDGKSATLSAISSNFDLALLKVSSPENTSVAAFSPYPAKLNEDITVVGFPLSNYLGGLNVTRGSVSSLKGMAGDEVTLQISAPVQPGNSGGPALSSQGYVVGVVVSKLDALVVAEKIGDIPQNINFAIRSEAAKLFLSLNGVDPVIGSTTEALSPVEIAEVAAKFTGFIECYE